MEILFFVAIMASGQLLFKAASIRLPAATNPLDGVTSAIGEWRFLLALTLYAAATMLWIRILKHIPLSTVYPLAMGSTIALTAIASILIFKEPFSTTRAIGTALLIASIYLIAK